MQAQRQLAEYHARLGGSMAARRPVSGVQRAGGAGNTGVLIGANGPIGPGAATHQAQQQSRQGTPVGMPMGQSPRMGQVGSGGSPRIAQQQQGLPVGVGVAVGLGVQMEPQQPPQPQQPPPQQ